jgi:tetratricopeptide (TPR) repeat protein
VNAKLLISNLWGLLVTLIFTFSSPSLLAQIDDMDEDMPSQGEIKCKPDSFTTPYEKFQSDTITQKQISIWYSFGSEEFKHEQYKRAISYFWKVLVNDNTGQFKVVYSKIATCYYELARTVENKKVEYLDSTLLVIYRGLDKYPDYASLHYRAGSILSSLGRYECAIPHYEALVEQNPEELSYLKALANLFFQSEDQRAIEVQQKVVEMAPDDVESANLLVQMYQFFGLDPIEPMRSAFENDTTNIPNALRYGKEALIIGQYKEALRAFNAILKVSPNHMEALEQKAKSYEGLDRTYDAINTYRGILKIDPKNISVLCSAARAYLRLNNFSAARSQVSQAKRIDPNNGEPYMVMADIYIAAAEYCSNKRGENKYNYDDKLIFEKAVNELKKAERDPNYRAAASSRRNGLKNFVRTKEDIFMVGRENLKDEDGCYSWIQ